MIEDIPAIWEKVRAVAIVIAMGLPLMSGLCFWQALSTSRQGDDAMSRSWADATKSFAGMMVGSWLVLWCAHLGYQQLLITIAELQAGQG